MVLTSFQVRRLARRRSLRQAHLAGTGRIRVCPPSHPPCLQACNLLGVCLRKEVRMDHLSGRGGRGSAGRMWSVCIFCLLLKLTSLHTQVSLPRRSPEEASASTPSLTRNPAKTNPYPSRHCSASQSGPRRPAARSSGTIWCSGREGRKTISNSRRPGLLQTAIVGRRKTQTAEEPRGAAGRGEDIEVRGCRLGREQGAGASEDRAQLYSSEPARVPFKSLCFLK